MDVDRRLRRSENPNSRILLVWLVLSAILLLAGMESLLKGEFPDPDDALRLVQVRDLLAGQSWFDTTQYRIDPVAPVPMHWSRLVDIPLLLGIAILTPLFGVSAAETITLIAVPLLTFGATLLVIGRLAWRLLGMRVAILACLACGFLPALLIQFQPMRIDHHGWQIFVCALALWGISWRNALHGGAVAGAAMALGLTISIELLPLAAAFGGVLFLRWWRDAHDRWWLVAYMAALALGLAVLFLLTRGLGEPVQYCDAITLAHIGFFLVTALGTGAIAHYPKYQRDGLLALMGLTGALGFALFSWSAPSCLAAPFSTLDPLVYEYWYLNVLEGQPLWNHKAEMVLSTVPQMVVALAATLILRARSAAWLHRWWGEYALLLTAAILLSAFVTRSLAFASIIAAIPLGWLVNLLLDRLRTSSALLVKLSIIGAFTLLLVPSVPIALASFAMPEDLDESDQALAVEKSSCHIRDQAEKLAVLPTGTIFAPLDIGPAILVKSDHSVVATSHHRAEMAMADVIRAFTSEPDSARAIIADHGSDYLILCTDLVEPQLFAARHPEGLAARLINGEAPEWLEPVPLEGPKEFRIWKVKPEKSAFSGE